MSIVPVDERDILLAEALNGLLGEISDLSGLVYRGTVEEFLVWFESNPHKRVSAAFAAYIGYLKDRNLSPRTIEKKRVILRRYFEWLKRVGLLTHNDLADVRDVKGPKAQGGKAGRWLTVDQIRQLLNSVDNLRDKAMLAVMLGCALRANEVVSFRWDQLTQQGETHVILNLARKHNRVQDYVPVPMWVVKILQEWEEFSREKLGSDCVFPYTTRTVYNIVRKHTSRCGFGKVAPHDLRRSASEMANKNGLPIDQISKLLGHASILVTQRYLENSFDIKATSESMELDLI